LAIVLAAGSFGFAGSASAYDDDDNAAGVAVGIIGQVIGGAIESMEALDWKTDVIDQMLADETVEAGRMRVIDTDELVQRERGRT